MPSNGQISGVAVAVLAAGALLIVSGIKDAPVLDALRDIMQGKTPQGRAAEPARIGARASMTGAGEALGAAAAGAAEAVAKLMRPVPGAITSPYGMRGGRMHRGVDIPQATGTPIVASAAGTVTNTGYEPLGAGNFVTIKHSTTLTTKYFHLSRILVSRSQSVSAGQQIGLVGSTGNSSGPHLHYEVWVNGKDVDPAGYI